MNYDFTLDRKGMFSVLASSILLGALLFLAGVILGSYWTANGPTVSAAAAKRNAADKGLNALAQEPVRPELAQYNLTAPDKPPATINSEKTGTAALAAPPPVTQTSSAPQQQAAAETQQAGDNNAAANAPANNPEKQDAKPDEASAAAQAAVASDLVTVEVGTFLDANAANHLFKDLERKGYAPTFFTGRDAQSREWHSIRIGAYSDKQQAENAAANFSKQEKRKAVVRPLGSL